MQWIKFSDKAPGDGRILYYDAAMDEIYDACVYDNGAKVACAGGYYCNDPKCGWIYDDCGCDLIISKNDWWMPLPAAPKLDEK